MFEELAYNYVETDMEKTGIDVIMDARHCWRENAMFTKVICLGDKTHKAIRVETVSKKQEAVSQKHELVGFKQIYRYLQKP